VTVIDCQCGRHCDLALSVLLYDLALSVSLYNSCASALALCPFCLPQGPEPLQCGPEPAEPAGAAPARPGGAGADAGAGSAGGRVHLAASLAALGRAGRVDEAQALLRKSLDSPGETTSSLSKRMITKRFICNCIVPKFVLLLSLASAPLCADGGQGSKMKNGK